ncbi:MAG: hypothetical protein GW903_02750 [Alphaproteobacteria bacterium]|nr:hypothetical protein [Alphaproteobacteria bacterium]NCQ87892.1 hypothetical protein [Alphaproteobacteria bacterium]
MIINVSRQAFANTLADTPVMKSAALAIVPPTVGRALESVFDRSGPANNAI